MWRTQAAVFCIIYVHPPPWPPPPRYINIRHTLLTCIGHTSWCGIGDSNKLHMWFSDIHPLCSDWPSLPKYQIFSCLFKGVCVCVSFHRVIQTSFRDNCCCIQQWLIRTVTPQGGRCCRLQREDLLYTQTSVLLSLWVTRADALWSDIHIHP